MKAHGSDACQLEVAQQKRVDRRTQSTRLTRRSPTQTSVFKSLLNCASEMSLSRNATGREFQRHGPATEKLLSPRRVRVLAVAHVKTPADRMTVIEWFKPSLTYKVLK